MNLERTIAPNSTGCTHCSNVLYVNKYTWFMADDFPLMAKRVDVAEQVSGSCIHDPYHWLEYQSSEAQEWVTSQDHYAAHVLGGQPIGQYLQARLKQLWEGETVTLPIQRGDRFFYQKRRSAQQLPVLYWKEGLEGQPRSLLDPNQLSLDHTLTLKDIYPSPDGKLLAYTASQQGNSQLSLQVLEVDTGELLSDNIPADRSPATYSWPQQCNEIAWLPDNSGFYYTRRPNNAPPGHTQYDQKVYFHRLGDRYTHDRLVFGETLSREHLPYPCISADGRSLVIFVQATIDNVLTSELYYCDLTQPSSTFIPVIGRLPALLQVHLHQDQLFLFTNHQSPFGTILSISLSKIEHGLNVESAWYSHCQSTIAERHCILGQWAIVRDYIIVEWIENAVSHLWVYGLLGDLIQKISLPIMGCIESMRADQDSQFVFIAFSSLLASPTIYRFDVDSMELTIEHQVHTSWKPQNFDIKQVWYHSSDRTQVPMFLVYQKGLETNGENPVVLHGYGGFNVSLQPKFRASIIPFLEQGGVYAIANIRGGGEFGTAWYRGGILDNQQNSFDDFIAAGEWLIREGYTNVSSLGCFGWSNGGLLVNTAAVQRPDLWQAVVAGSPVTDMARFHLAGNGQRWISDYGSPDCPEDLAILMTYSPYHTMPSSIHAPAILTIVPDDDDRVPPWHGYKMVAQWQAANSSDHPILLRREAKAGHKGRIALDKMIERDTAIWTFFFWQFKMGKELSR